MNKAAERLLDAKNIENTSYCEALNGDFEKMPFEVYSDVRAKIDELLDFDFLMDLGEQGDVIKKNVRKIKGQMVSLCADVNVKSSELRKWALRFLDNLEKDIPDVPAVSGKRPVENFRLRVVHQSGKAPNPRMVQDELRRKISLTECIDLNRMAIDLFASVKKGECKLESVFNLIDANLGKFDLVNVVTILFNFGKLDGRHFTCGPYEMRCYLNRLASRMNSLKGELSAQHIGSVFYGLKNFDSSIVPPELISAIHAKLAVSEAMMDNQAIGLSLYGLNNLDASVVPARLLHLLAKKIRASDAELDRQAIQNSLYGLRSLDSTVVPKELLMALAEKVDASGAQMDSVGIGNAFYGLHNLDSGVVPRELLLALSKKMGVCGVELDGFSISNSLYGLQNLDSGTVPAQLLHVLAEKISESRGVMSALQIGNALYGLQKMDSASIPKSLLAAIYKKLIVSGAEFEMKHIVSALYGIRRLGGSEAEKIRSYLVGILNEKGDSMLKTQKDLDSIVQLVNLLKLPKPQWLQKKIKCVPEAISPSRLRSPTEAIADSLLRGQGIRNYQTNVLVDRYEMDLFFPSIKLDIEIDGHYHEARNMQDRLRDEFLKTEYGITVERVRTVRGWRESLEDIVRKYKLK